MSEPLGQLGKYSLTRHLATGGMAEIWLAEQAGPGGFNKELVIKRILPHFAEDATFTTMFLDEARLAAQLSHPKIAQIYELGEIDGQYFIAMEYIPGIDLDVLLHQVTEGGEHIPIGVVCKIVMDVCEALDYAHDYTDREGQPYNLVHRDVSPHNVLVSNDGIVKLCDFGVAKAKANQTKTQPGAVKGKFAYMAPEQIQNAEDLDRRADLFAVGVMLFELLAGEKPFGDELAAVNNIIAAPHPDVRQKREDVPDALATVIDRTLAKSRDDRYPDAHAVLRDIESVMRGLDEYVGDRELARYVRTIQGLPVTRHSQPVPPIMSDAVPVQAPTEDDKRVTNREPAVDAAEPARTPAHTTESEFAIDGPAPKSNAPLVIVALLVIAGIVGAIVWIGATMIEGKKAPKTTPTVTKPDKPTKGPKADKSLLMTGTKRVSLSSRPDGAEIYVDGKLAGTTPFTALLSDGEHTLEFRSKSGGVQSKTFTVPQTKSVRAQF